MPARRKENLVCGLPRHGIGSNATLVSLGIAKRRLEVRLGSGTMKVKFLLHSSLPYVTKKKKGKK